MTGPNTQNPTNTQTPANTQQTPQNTGATGGAPIAPVPGAATDPAGTYVATPAARTTTPSNNRNRNIALVALGLGAAAAIGWYAWNNRNTTPAVATYTPGAACISADTVPFSGTVIGDTPYNTVFTGAADSTNSNRSFGNTKIGQKVYVNVEQPDGSVKQQTLLIPEGGLYRTGDSISTKRVERSLSGIVARDGACVPTAGGSRTTADDIIRNGINSQYEARNAGNEGNTRLGDAIALDTMVNHTLYNAIKK